MLTRTTDTTTTAPAAARRTATHPAADASRRTLFAAPALLALAALPTVAALPVNPDAALLDLGARFEAAWTDERAAWAALVPEDEFTPAYERACVLSEAVGELVDQIEPMRATSLPGLLVKGRALRWHHGLDEPIGAGFFDLRPFLRHWEPSAEQLLIVSILADLHALTAGAAA